MKKLISICLALTMVFALSTNAFAYDLSQDSASKDEIEVYVTRISTETLSTKYLASEDNEIDFDRLRIDACATKNAANDTFVTTVDFSTLKNSTDPIMQRAMTLLNDTREQGWEVHAVNIVLPYDDSQELSLESNMTRSTTGDPDDPNYWIENSTYWGTYQNQDIRYWFTSFSVSKPKANVGSRPSTWPSVLSAVVRVAVDRLVGLTPFDTVYSAITDVQSVLGAATPANYTSDSATEWVKSEIIGTLTYKDVLLEDIHDRVDGYAYYIWGSLQRLQFQTRLEVKYYAGLKNGSPDYPVITSPYSSSKYVNSRYYNNSSALFPILWEYYNYLGYTTYSESVDLASALF